MPEKKIISTEKAPKAIGPYSQGVQFGNLIFTAGQLGLDPASGELIPGGIEMETRRALENIRQVLESSGSSLQCVLKTTVFLRDMKEFSRMNGIYNEFFSDDYPARTTVEVATLPRNGAVEIDAIAYSNDN